MQNVKVKTKIAEHWNSYCIRTFMASSHEPIKGWFTLATESEAESESVAQGALWSSVNQKPESEAESEARRNRSQKDQ